MRPAGEATARYWRCGGEILMLGGPLPLRGADGAPTAGCRPVGLEALRRLADWHLAELAGDRAVGFHRPAARDALAVLAAAG